MAMVFMKGLTKMVKPAKQGDLVSFRPGELAGEFAKRAPDGQMSTVAKTLAAQTFTMLRAELAQLAGKFGPAEMQVIVTALYDGPNDPSQMTHTVTQAIAHNAMVGAIARRYKVDTAALISNVGRLYPGTRFAIQDAVIQLRRLPIQEALGLNAFPSLAALRRIGLLATQGPAAWGLCSVQLSNYSNFTEFVLRRDPKNVGLKESSYGIDELALAIVGYTRAMMDGEVDPDKDVAGHALAYSIALKTGWRYFRVDEREGGEARAVQISRETILSDLHDGSLQDLTLEGINAPEITQATPSERAGTETNTPTRPRKPRGKRK
jgi:hypothetical protein